MRELFEEEYEYRRAVSIFTYDHLRNWVVEAHVTNRGPACAKALKWEASRRFQDPIEGSYGIFQQQEQTLADRNAEIYNLKLEVEQLKQKLNESYNEIKLLEQSNQVLTDQNLDLMLGR
jgi:hypothetical protein